MNDHKYCLHCGLDKQHACRCTSISPRDYQTDEWSTRINHLPAGTTLYHQQYMICRVLGAGGFGVTYLAVDTRLGMRLAVKELFPFNSVVREGDGTTVSPLANEQASYEEFKKKFLKEAQVLVPFNEHPNIVSIKSFFEENGTAYIVMPFLEGAPLDAYLKANGNTLSVDRAVSIAVAVLDGLRATHAQNILHRDIKPQNIFITDDGMVKLIDFGSAREVVDAQSKLTAFVSEGYTPFEQYQSQLQQSPSADIYAVGATLYRMLTGDVPPPAVVRMVEDTLVSPSQKTNGRVDTAISDAVVKALAPKAEDRFQSADDFAKVLLGTEASPPSFSLATQSKKPSQLPDDLSNEKRVVVPQTARSSHKRHRKLIIGMVTAALVSIAAISVDLIFSYFSTGNQLSVSTQTTTRNQSEGATQKEPSVHPVATSAQRPQDGTIDLGNLPDGRIEKMISALVMSCMATAGNYYYEGDIGIPRIPAASGQSSVIRLIGDQHQVDFKQVSAFADSSLGRCITKQLSKYRMRGMSKDGSFQKSIRFGVAVPSAEAVAGLDPDIVLTTSYGKRKFAAPVTACMKQHGVASLTALIGPGPSGGQTRFRPIHVHPGTDNNVDGITVSSLPDTPLGQCVGAAVSTFKAHQFIKNGQRNDVIALFSFDAN